MFAQLPLLVQKQLASVLHEEQCLNLLERFLQEIGHLLLVVLLVVLHRFLEPLLELPTESTEQFSQVTTLGTTDNMSDAGPAELAHRGVCKGIRSSTEDPLDLLLKGGVRQYQD